MRSDDEETAQTVSYMDELAAADANDPAVIAATAEALDAADMDVNASPLQKAHAVFWFLKRTVRYVPTPGTSPLVDQTLITPTAILAMPEPIGDCPQFSMLAAAMFRVLCMECLFVTIAAEKMVPDQWSHIYNTVEVAPGVFMPFDSSNGPEPGAEYAKPFKRRVWPRLTPGKCRTKEGGSSMLRGIHRNTATGLRNAVTRRALRGLGDVNCDSDGNCYDDTTGTYTPAPVLDICTDPSCMMSGPNPTAAQLNQPIYPTGVAPTVTPATSSVPGIFTTLLNDAASIAAPIVRSATQQQPYYITNPATGQSVLYNPNTGTTASGVSAALGSVSPVVLLAGLAVLGFLALGKR